MTYSEKRVLSSEGLQTLQELSEIIPCPQHLKIVGFSPDWWTMNSLNLNWHLSWICINPDIELFILIRFHWKWKTSLCNSCRSDQSLSATFFLNPPLHKAQSQPTAELLLIFFLYFHAWFPNLCRAWTSLKARHSPEYTVSLNKDHI